MKKDNSKNYYAWAVVAITALIGAFIGGYLGGMIKTENTSTTGELIKAWNEGCHYETMQGEFLILSSAPQPAFGCEYNLDNNYDPFNYGEIIIRDASGNNLTYSENCGAIIKDYLTEYSCDYSNSTKASWVITTGVCTLGCENGACIKSKRVLVCPQTPSSGSINPPSRT